MDTWAHCAQESYTKNKEVKESYIKYGRSAQAAKLEMIKGTV